MPVLIKSFFTAVIAGLLISVVIIAHATASDGIVWLIEPEFDYEKILYCSYCNYYSLIQSALSQNQLYERATAIKESLQKNYGGNGIIYIGDAHGFNVSYYYHDSVKDIFIVMSRGESGPDLSFFTPEEFYRHRNESEWINNEAIIPVQKADSDIFYYNSDNTISANASDITGKYALLYKGKFITDYVYDEIDVTGAPYHPNRIINVIKNGKHGVVNQTGATVIPFIFEDIVFIDDDLAFAKYGGRYGIIDVGATIANYKGVNSSATGDGGLIILPIIILAIVFIPFIKFTNTKIYINKSKGEHTA